MSTPPCPWSEGKIRTRELCASEGCPSCSTDLEEAGELVCIHCRRPVFVERDGTLNLVHRMYEHTRQCDARGDGATLSTLPHEVRGAPLRPYFRSTASLCGNHEPHERHEVSPGRDVVVYPPLECPGVPVPEDRCTLCEQDADQLIPWRGERLCWDCVDLNMDLLARAIAEATPVRIGSGRVAIGHEERMPDITFEFTPAAAGR